MIRSGPVCRVLTLFTRLELRFGATMFTVRTVWEFTRHPVNSFKISSLCNVCLRVFLILTQFARGRISDDFETFTLSLSRSHCLPLSLPLTFSLPHSLSLTRSVSLSHFLLMSLSPSLIHSLSLTLSLTHLVPLSLNVSVSHSLSMCLSLSHSLSLILLSLSL